MIKKKIIDKERIRRIDGGFAFIPHRFLTGGFVSDLSRDQLLLYFFLCLAADRFGLSFYSYDKICTLLEMSLDQYIDARCALIKKDLIAFDGTVFQVLALPAVLPKAKPGKPHPLGQLAKNIFKEVAP
ncbi:hypothetical protein DSCO28_15210 [Desulfosarcina ovata subsp. sediminis]|uniref:Uncharacterized protein n=1 Tax=Desulfosarcina ovata subsp. sediminis TaxID=885957 RepID=A0A5K7ZL26_9BACT|nr:hypothetical protein [Desulfosarcina ovata]BBO80955.1 hypothetical protein DSCO28_15210 [Desulfosarcina ovata subsp. sediminis]